MEQSIAMTKEFIDPSELHRNTALLFPWEMVIERLFVRYEITYFVFGIHTSAELS